jgi:predicted transcriptional regulator
MSGLFDRLGHELNSREKAAGLSMADVLSLPDELRKLFNWMMRQEEVSIDDVVTHLGNDESTVQRTLSSLVEKGFIRQMEVKGQFRYKVRLAPKRGREVPLNIWQALDEKTQKEGGE